MYKKLEFNGRLIVYSETGHRYLLNPTWDGKTEKYKKGTRLPGVTTITGLFGDKGGLIGWSEKCYHEKAGHLLREYCGEGNIENVSASLLRADIQENVLDAAKGEYKRKREDAGAVGTAVHRITEAYIKLKMGTITEDEYRNILKDMYDGDKRIADGVRAFKDFFDGISGRDGFKLLGAEELVAYSRTNDEPDYCTQIDLVYSAGGKTYLLNWKTGGFGTDNDGNPIMYPETKLQLMLENEAYCQTMGLSPNESIISQAVFLLKEDKTVGETEFHAGTHHTVNLEWKYMEAGHANTIVNAYTIINDLKK